MNFLAHIFLSGDDPQIRLGNFIGDEIKGKNYQEFPDKIKRGILLHRHIDSFTDTHPETLKILTLLYPKLGKVAGVALDIYNDHFLAKNWSAYSDSDLDEFTQEFYRQIDSLKEYLPHSIQRLFYYMRKDNWLLNYRSKSRLSETFTNLVKRYPFTAKLNYASEVLIDHYIDIEAHFGRFFPELQRSVEFNFE